MLKKRRRKQLRYEFKPGDKVRLRTSPNFSTDYYCIVERFEQNSNPKKVGTLYLKGLDWGYYAGSYVLTDGRKLKGTVLYCHPDCV